MYPLVTAPFSVLLYFNTPLKHCIYPSFPNSFHSYYLKLTVVRLLASPLSSFCDNERGSCQVSYEPSITKLTSQSSPSSPRSRPPWNTFFMWLLEPHSPVLFSYFTGPSFFLVSHFSPWHENVAVLQHSVLRPLPYLHSVLRGEPLVSLI